MKVWTTTVLVAVTAGALGCENLPGSREDQGTVIGGAAGAAAGAALYEQNRLLGALIGGALGAGGGYLIGARTDWFEDPEDSQDDAREAIENAQSDPATVDDVEGASTADLNEDGFVTTDELVAMDRAGLTDDEIIRRLRATGQIFELTEEQKQTLERAGISRRVVDEMPQINGQQRGEVLGKRTY